MAKRVIIGVLALVVFGIILVQLGRINTVTGVAEQVLPKPPASPAPTTAPQVTQPLADQGLYDPASNAIKPNAVVVILDKIPAPTTAPIDEYRRAAFGPAWADVDHNGCDTRNDILRRDLTKIAYRPGTHDCVVVSGLLDNPYTGQEIRFDKAKATGVPIDHMVPLSWAWQHGAASWTPEQRLAFANDPRNLTAVDQRSNSSKSDKGPAEWMPEYSGYSCQYVTRFVYVVDAYQLSIDDADRQSIRRTLAGC